MKKIIVTTLIASAIFSFPIVFNEVSAVNTDDNKRDERGTLSVSYTAEKEVAPDTVEVSIAVRTEDKKSMQVASQKNKEISDSVYTYLKTVITPANGDFIKTSNFSARPVYIYNNGKKFLDKYQVSNNIIVHTKSIDKISTMIDKSISIGATDVDSLNFSLSEKDAQCAELLGNASKNVKKRADIVASSAGSAVTGIKSIDTSCSFNRNGAVNYARNSLMLAKSAGAAEDAAKPEVSVIEAGVIKIYSNIHAVFYVK